MAALLTGIQTRLEDQLRIIKYQPWFLFLGGLTKRTWISVVLGTFALAIIVTLLVLTNTSETGCNILKRAGDEEPCVFPFSYKGALYKECTTVDNSGVAWCSTQTDHEGVHTKGKWGNCDAGCAPGCSTVSGPVEGGLCVFPFRWQGKVYRECTSAHNDGILWCATQTDRQGNYVDDKWGHCEEKCSGCGTVEGASCIFPFTFQDTTYSECTTYDNNGTLWCALGTDTGGNWRSDKHTWGNCGAGCTAGCHTYSGMPCMLPFQYNGTKHTQCAEDEHSNNDLRWCATELLENGTMAEGKWEYCAGGCS